ncbi:hypothetical protein [Intestinibacter bartlettii]
MECSSFIGGYGSVAISLCKSVTLSPKVLIIQNFSQINNKKPQLSKK